MPGIPGLSLSIDGSQAPTTLMDIIREVEIGSGHGVASRFALRTEPESVAALFRSLDDVVGTLLAPGTKMEIAHVQRRKKVVLLEGHVTSVGVDLDGAGTGGSGSILIEGYDRAHAMAHHERVRTFLAMKSSEIAAQLAGEHGLKADVDDSQFTWPHLLQAGEADWDFLTHLASRIGYELYVESDTLHFKQAGTRGTLSLNWGPALVEFNPKLTLASQTTEIEVRGWDPATKKAIVSETTVGTGRRDPHRVLEDSVVRSQAEANGLAESLAGSIRRSSMKATGLVRPGLTGLRPGVVAKITGVGETLSGEYFISSATHRLSRDDGYTTRFDAGHGFNGDGARAGAPGVCNLAVGVVTDNADPDDLARVRVKFPQLSGDQESVWARVAAPMAGKERGTYFLPEVDDEVLVGFDHGDFQAPYIMGSLWNGVDKPPWPDPDHDGRKEDVRSIVSRSGHRIRLDDTDGAECIELTTARGGHRIRLDDARGGSIEIKTEGQQVIRLDDASGRVEIADKEETSSLVMTSGRAGQIRLHTGGAGRSGHTITIDSKTNDVVIESEGDLRLSANKNLSLKASGNITLDAVGQLALKGGQASLTGQSAAAVKGAVTRIEGDAQTIVKGGVVKIN